jgi:hypothetical protein
MHDLTFYNFLTFITVGSLLSSTLAIIFIITKFCCYIKNREKNAEACRQYREDRSNFESFRLRNRLFNFSEDEVDTSQPMSTFF